MSKPTPPKMRLIFIAALLGLISGAAGTALMIISYGLTIQTILCAAGVLLALIGTIALSSAASGEIGKLSKMLSDTTNELKKKSDLLHESEEEAEAAQAAADALISNVTGDITSPIYGIMGMNELILRESQDNDIRSYAAGIRSASNSLLDIIGEIFSSDSRGEGTAAYRLSEIFAELTEMLSLRIYDNIPEISFIADPQLPDELQGNGAVIKKALSSLLINSLKYTAGRVTLEIAGEYTASGVRLDFRIVSTEADIPSESAGVKNAERLLKLIGSELKISGGSGTIFLFSLDQQLSGDKKLGAVEYKPTNNINRTYRELFTAPGAEILIADRNRMNRTVLRDLLGRTRVNISEASKISELYKLTAERRFDLILIDDSLLSGDNAGVPYKIKTQPNGSCTETPIIAIASASRNVNDTNFSDIILKPIDPSRLEEVIKQQLPAELVKEASAPLHKIPEAQVILPEIEDFNWEYAELHNPDRRAILSNVEQYGENLSGTRAMLSALSQQLDNGDNLELYKIQAHSLYEISAAVGELMLSQLAKAAEAAAAGSNLERVTAITPILIEEMAKCESRLAAHNLFALKSECADMEELKQNILTLMDSMNSLDFDIADQLMEHIYQYNYSDELQPMIEMLNLAEVNLDAESVNSICGDILGKIDASAELVGV